MLSHRILAGAALAVGLAATCGSAFAYEAMTIGTVNVRSGPGTSYPVVGTLAAGSTVSVNDCHVNWCMVEATGEPSGWISSMAIEATSYVRDDYGYDDFFDDDDFDHDDDDYWHMYHHYMHHMFHHHMDHMGHGMGGGHMGGWDMGGGHMGGGHMGHMGGGSMGHGGR